MSKGARILLIAVAVAVVVVVLFTVVFPWVDQMVADPTLGVSWLG